MSYAKSRVSALRSAALSLAAALSLGLTGTAQAADENVMVVFDGSNSMWGQIDGTAKIEIARGVMENLLGDWTEDRKVGLMAYGHRQRGDCSDIETLVAPGADTRAAILDRINAITPTGKTPLTDAIEQAATELSYTDTPATVVLISDGLESCERDPCALADTLGSRGVAFTAHVVGFGLGADQDSGSLSCIAERTGGQYIQAANADELGRALGAISTAVAAAPEPEPVPEPEPELPAVTLTAPDSALAGSSFRIGWDPTLDPGDYVTIVPVGTPEGDYAGYVRVRDKSEADFRAPADTGLYELRYMTSKGGKVLGSTPIEITAPEVTVSGPESALAGSSFTVAWTGAVHGQDYVTIVPMGADEGSHGDYTRVRDAAEGNLQAPADTGMYEIRYVLDEGKRTMASQPIEITAPEVTLSAQDKLRAGDALRVEWAGAVHPQDYITLVPMGTPDGDHAEYFRVRDGSSHDITAPDQPGLYELRYMLNEGRRVMARHTVEILAADAPLSSGASLSAPDSAAAGSQIEVGWSVDSTSADQRITLARADQAIFTWLSATKVDGPPPLSITLPDEPGSYELRFLDVTNQSVLARKVLVVE